MALGQRIAAYRKELGISQEELGARLGVSRQAVSKWETGAATPDMANLIALAQTFQVSVAELTETPASPPPVPLRTPKPRSRVFLRCLLFAALSGLLIWFFRYVNVGRENAPPPADTPLPETEFYLYWHVYQGDGSHSREFLALGPQETEFPFGTSLERTAPEEVVATDFAGMTHHRAVCGGITVEYNRMEDENGSQEVVTSLSTMASGFATPQGIFPGETKDDLLFVYEDLVYCLKEDGNSPAPHDHYYVYSIFEENLGYASILFYMKDGLVTGLRLELMQDAGNAYAPDNVSRFPMKDGQPDFSARQEPEREILNDTQRVYIAFNRLVTNNNLTAEEQYAYRRDIFTLLPDMDWSELGKMGAAEYPEDTIFALLNWLERQDTYTMGEISYIQQGCTAQGLDGAYTDAYSGLLSWVFFYDPAAFAKSLATGYLTEEQTLRVIRLTAYDAEWHPTELETALEVLDRAVADRQFTEAEAGWARLLRLYLTTPIDDRKELPKSPEGL